MHSDETTLQMNNITVKTYIVLGKYYTYCRHLRIKEISDVYKLYGEHSAIGYSRIKIWSINIMEDTDVLYHPDVRKYSKDDHH